MNKMKNLNLIAATIITASLYSGCALQKMVKLAEKQNRSLEELSLADMQNIEPAITKNIFDALDINTALNSRNSFGATAPKNVIKACTQARHKYLK